MTTDENLKSSAQSHRDIPVTPDEAAGLDFAEVVLKEKAGDFMNQLDATTKDLDQVEVVEDNELETAKKWQVVAGKIRFYLLASVTDFLAFVKAKLNNFKSWDIKKKIVASGLLLASFSVLFYFGWILKKRWITFHKQPLFVTSLEQLGSAVYFFSPDDNKEPFYDSMRVVRNIFALGKVYSNLRPNTDSSKKGGMAVFEFVIEGAYPEVTAEIKGRESEFRDLAQSILMGFSSSELNTIEGKAELVEQMRLALNGKLESGLVRKVLIRNMVLKN